MFFLQTKRWLKTKERNCTVSRHKITSALQLFLWKCACPAQWKDQLGEFDQVTGTRQEASRPDNRGKKVHHNTFFCWVHQFDRHKNVRDEQFHLQSLCYHYYDDELKQGNYSLRRPPKLTIPQAVIGQRWLLLIQTCTSKHVCMYVCMTHIPALTPS